MTISTYKISRLHLDFFGRCSRGASSWFSRTPVDLVHCSFSNLSYRRSGQDSRHPGDDLSTRGRRQSQAIAIAFPRSLLRQLCTVKKCTPHRVFGRCLRVMNGPLATMRTRGSNHACFSTTSPSSLPRVHQESDRDRPRFPGQRRAATEAKERGHRDMRPLDLRAIGQPRSCHPRVEQESRPGSRSHGAQALGTFERMSRAARTWVRVRYRPWSIGWGSTAP